MCYIAPVHRPVMAFESGLAVRNFPPAGIQVPPRDGQLRLPPPGKRTLITRQPVAQGASWGALRDIGYSVMEAPRHVDEVLGEYADLLRDNILLVITAALGFVVAEGASAFFAVTPGFQPLAFLIQYALGLIGCLGSAVMIEDATRQGQEWIRLARTANGDRKKIALASKAFVRTFFDLLMAGLGGMAAARNFGKAGAIANTAPPGGPPLALAGGGQLVGTNVADSTLDPFALGSGIPTAMAMSKAKPPSGKSDSQEAPNPTRAPMASFSDDELAQHARAIRAIAKANHKVIRHRLLDMISRAIDALAKAHEVRVPAVFSEPVELLVRFNRRRWTIVVSKDLFELWNVGPQMAKFARDTAEVAHEIRQVTLAARYLATKKGRKPHIIAQQLEIPGAIAEHIVDANWEPLTSVEIEQARRFLTNLAARDNATHQFKLARNNYDAARTKFLKDAEDGNVSYRDMDSTMANYAQPVKDYKKSVDDLSAYPEQQDLVATGVRAQRAFASEAELQRSPRSAALPPLAPKAGLRDARVMTSFANFMRDLRHAWPQLSPAERIAELEHALNTQLRKCGIAEVTIAEAELPGAMSAVFSPNDWTIFVNRALLVNAGAAPRLFGALTNTLAQQGRRVEQHYRVVVHQYFYLEWAEEQILAEGYPRLVIDAVKKDREPPPMNETMPFFHALSPAGDEYGLVETVITAIDDAYDAYARAQRDYTLALQSDSAAAPALKPAVDKAADAYNVLVRLLESFQTETDARIAGDTAEKIFRTGRGPKGL